MRCRVQDAIPLDLLSSTIPTDSNYLLRMVMETTGFLGYVSTIGEMDSSKLTNIAGWKIHHVNGIYMYLLGKMGTIHICYVSLPECMYSNAGRAATLHEGWTHASLCWPIWHWRVDRARSPSKAVWGSWNVANGHCRNRSPSCFCPPDRLQSIVPHMDHCPRRPQCWFPLPTAGHLQRACSWAGIGTKKGETTKQQKEAEAVRGVRFAITN